MRPHPSENAAPWKAIVAEVPRAETLRQGAAVSWILAADLLVHTYCTTGVEAFALGKPAICFRPAESPVLDNYLSPQINFAARTPEEVIERAAAITAAGDSFVYPAEFRARFDRSFAAQSGAFAAERIVQQLSERFGVTPSPDAARALWQPGRGYIRHVLSKKHNRRLMPAITPAEIERRLRRFAEAIGRAQRFTIEPCGERVFHIHGHAERARRRMATKQHGCPAGCDGWRAASPPAAERLSTVCLQPSLRASQLRDCVKQHRFRKRKRR